VFTESQQSIELHNPQNLLDLSGHLDVAVYYRLHPAIAARDLLVLLQEAREEACVVSLQRKFETQTRTRQVEKG